MGKDFLPLKLNNIRIDKAIKTLYWAKNVFEASKIEYFHVLPPVSSIQEIEIGTYGTDETIIRLKNGDFIALNKTMQVDTLKSD